MAQGKEEAETLLDKTKLLWDNLDSDIKKFLNIDIKRNNTTEFSFTNDSTIFVRMSFRSTTLQRLHISEFGKIANKNPILAKETMTGTLQAISPGNTTIIESTAEGENRFKNIWERAELNSHNRTKKDFKPVFLSWLQDPDCSEDVEQIVTPESEKYFNNVEKKLSIKLTSNQKNFWIAKYRELETKKGKSDVYQEYPTTSDEAFIASRDGTYYANLYYIHIRNKNREINNLYDPNLKIQVATDLGINDLFTIIIFQTYTDGWRIIEDYKNHGFGIKHYCDYLNERIEKMGYTKNPLILLPHDAWVRGLNTGITREEAFNNYNYTNTYVIDKTPDINNDIELVRQELKNTYIDPQASFIIDCILNYSKEADDKRDIWKNKPLHNIYSHDAWVRGLNTGITREEAFNNYNYTNTYVIDKTPDINNDIELVRQELKNTYIDPQAPCEYILCRGLFFHISLLSSASLE